jgi:hypothetical protein
MKAKQRPDVGKQGDPKTRKTDESDSLTKAKNGLT